MGGRGRDIIFGGEGVDVIDGNKGADLIYGCKDKVTLLNEDTLIDCV